jgi:hypothetical protein
MGNAKVYKKIIIRVFVDGCRKVAPSDIRVPKLVGLVRPAKGTGNPEEPLGTLYIICSDSSFWIKEQKLEELSGLLR